MSRAFFSAAEFADRQEKVRSAMDDAGIDLLLVFAPTHVNYLIGTPTKGFQEFQVLFFPREPAPLTVLTRLCEVPQFKAESLAEDIRGWGGREPEDPIAAFRQVMEEKGWLTRRIGLEVPAYYLHPHDHRKLVDMLGDSLVMDATNLIGNVKLIKSPAEIEYVRKAADILDKGMDTCRSSIEEGRTEREVSADIHHTMLVSGSDIPSSPMNFLTGPRTAFAHGEPTDRVLRAGDFMHLQVGAHYRRYTCIIGRQLCLGEPTPRMRDIYQIARDAGDACIAEIRAGVPAVVPHGAAAKVIADAGMDRYRLHLTGYAVGAAFAPSWVEPLVIDSGCSYTLEAGMVVAVEPPLFGLEDEIGVRIVDVVLVTDTGCEPLSKTTRDLIVV